MLYAIKAKLKMKMSNINILGLLTLLTRKCRRLVSVMHNYSDKRSENNAAGEPAATA
jgi:hypothetical protein